MRIPTLLQKINELAAQPERCTAIDIDLMLDYTRVLYADLLEWRSRLPVVVEPIPQPTPVVPKEPTLEEVTSRISEAMNFSRPNTAAEPKAQNAVAPEKPQARVSIPDARDIRSMIGINDKYQIMSELFGNDRNAYEQTLDYINQCQSEQAATHWLREQLWITEERSDAATSFFEIVSRFFRS